MERRSLIWIIILVLVAYIMGTVGVYRALMTGRTATVWDFYQLWYGARVLLLEHRDPYDPQATLEMQQALYGRPALISEDRPAFYYPMPVLLLVAPFALIPYPLAASAWLCLLLFAVAAAVGVALWGLRWRVSPLGMVVLVLWALILFPVLWSVLLGQIAALLLLPLNVGLAALLHKRDGLAGVCLALTALKPQMACLLLPMLVVWALFNRRWYLLGALVATLLALGGVSWLLLPVWPAHFLASVTRYATVSPYAAPLQILLEGWLGLPVRWLWIGVGVVLLGGCLAVWLLPQEGTKHIAWAASVTLIVSALIVPRTGMINQLSLLWPALTLVRRMWFRRGWGSITSVALLGVMLVVPWVVVATITIPSSAYRYEVEHQALAPFLPILLTSASLACLVMPGALLASEPTA